MTDKRLIMDFETRSMCDLKRSGAYKYSLDPTTRPTCMAFKLGEMAVPVLFQFDRINLPWKSHENIIRSEWARYIREGYLFCGHNIFFDMAIYKNILVKRYGWPDIPFRQWRCTAAKAAACAIPRSLEGAGEAMNLTTQKDKRGLIAMMQTCRPTKEWNAWKKKNYNSNSILEEPPIFRHPDGDPRIFDTLYEYCKIDVITEELLDKSLPDLSPFEQEVWFLNQQINWRGIRVDVPTVRKIVDIMAVEGKSKLKELDILTMGLVTKGGARQSILDFLALEGIELPDIRSKTVDDALKNDQITGDMKRLLEIRKALSKTSTKKYQAFLDRSGDDNRIRDLLMYHGASTGRDAGTGINPQNFPRGLLKVDSNRPYAHVENVIECSSELLNVLYGDNLSVLFSAVLRNMILPSEGHQLFVGDFAKIEVAVLWWLAGNDKGLEVLNSGRDPYKYMAAANSGKKYETIPDEGDERQLGKAQVLGCGFGMGADKFQKTAWDMYRLKLTDEQSRVAVRNYREANPTIPQMWKNLEFAATAAIENKLGVFRSNKCEFMCDAEFLWITLPSGRRLTYRKPQIEWRETEYGPRKGIEFLGLGPDKKKLRYERTWGGTLTENVVQAVARDLMVYSSLAMEKAGYRVLLTVHDEIITETDNGTLGEFKNIMCSRPRWIDAKLPLDAKVWKGARYKK